MKSDNEITPVHCDEVINDYQANSHLRWFILINRMPAMLKCLASEMGCEPKLFADYMGKRVRVVMASRLGDVGITEDLDAENGYSERVYVDALTNFSNER
jgi:hypothetical protein